MIVVQRLVKSTLDVLVRTLKVKRVFVQRWLQSVETGMSKELNNVILLMVEHVQQLVDELLEDQYYQEVDD